MDLKDYLKSSEFHLSVKQILDCLCDGEFLSKFDVTQDEIEELYDYYLTQQREAL